MERPAKILEIDPRQKSGQGLDYWAKELFDARRITKKDYEHFCYANSHKEEEMRKRGLPQLEHYGFFNDVESLRKVAESVTEAKEGRAKFIIRCSNSEGEVRRLIDATTDEVCDFANKLPGGFGEWKVELKEFTETIQAGTLIVSSSGNVRMESWYGPHYLNTSNCPKFHAKFNNAFSQGGIQQENIDLSYKWSAPDGEEEKLPKIQDNMLRVIRTFIPKTKPGEGNPIYAEYGVRPDNSIYFIEANDSALLTDIN